MEMFNLLTVLLGRVKSDDTPLNRACFVYNNSEHFPVVSIAQTECPHWAFREKNTHME